IHIGELHNPDFRAHACSSSYPIKPPPSALITRPPNTSAPVIICGGGSLTSTPFVKFFLSLLNEWSRERNCRCLSNEEYLPPFRNQMNINAALHTGQGNFLWTHQP